MDEKKIILHIDKYYPVSLAALVKTFKCSGSSEYSLLVKTLNKLEERYLIARDESDNYLPFAVSDYRIGIIKITGGGYGFVDLEEGSYFIPTDCLLGALDGDSVLIKVGDFREATIVKVLIHSQKKLVLEVCSYYGKKQLLSLNAFINSPIVAVNEKEFNYSEGHYLETEIISYYPTLKVNIIKMLGHKNDLGMDITAILLDYQFSLEFPSAVMEETAKVTDIITKKELEGRVDHKELFTITIDGEDAKDLDDAISIAKEGDLYRLYVHIADVAHYVKENSALDKEAYKRSSSIYVVDRVVPMLPPSLTNGICSLNPQQPRLTITCEMMINQSGKTLSYDVYPSIIQVSERMTYTAVNEILAGDAKDLNDYPYLPEVLQSMKECADGIRQRREKAGALSFEKTETKFVLDKKGEVIELRARQRGAGELMIEDFMIAANEAVAKLMKKERIPSVYRVHDQPPAKGLAEFKTILGNFQIRYDKTKKDLSAKDLQNIMSVAKERDLLLPLSEILLRCMAKAVYKDKCSGHYGLALAEYLHFTSPIRRYADLVVHQHLHKYFFNKEVRSDILATDKKKVIEVAEYISMQERKIMAAEYAVEDRKKAEFMLKYQNQRFSGMITSVTKFGFYVELDNTVEGLVLVSSLDDYYIYDAKRCRWTNSATRKGFQLGQRINCRVNYIDVNRGIIEFAVINETKKNRERDHCSSSQKRQSPKAKRRRKDRGKDY